MISYQIYTDGSCRANGNGGIGVVWLKNGEKVFEYSKGVKNTTNNQMELLAIGIALRSIKKPIDSLEIIDLEKVVKATKIIDPIIEKMNLIDGEYILDVYAKSKGDD